MIPRPTGLVVFSMVMGMTDARLSVNAASVVARRGVWEVVSDWDRLVECG